MNIIEWYEDWQNEGHVSHFDFRSAHNARNLIRDYESFNDVRLLNERLDLHRKQVLLEVGCATGEFRRYLGIKHPQLEYYGLDISQKAIERAREKYPAAGFFVVDPLQTLTDQVAKLPIPGKPEIVYAKDVVHHQIQPWSFLSELLRIPSELLIFRCRTRDLGSTVLDPELSCQYHYNGWMPYIVINLEELLGYIRKDYPASEVVVYRNRMILGGCQSRFLPKECYLGETGTAETALGVFHVTSNPGRVRLEDRKDQNPQYTFDFQVRRFIARAARTVLGKNHS